MNFLLLICFVVKIGFYVWFLVFDDVMFWIFGVLLGFVLFLKKQRLM